MTEQERDMILEKIWEVFPLANQPDREKLIYANLVNEIKALPIDNIPCTKHHDLCAICDKKGCVKRLRSCVTKVVEDN